MRPNSRLRLAAGFNRVQTAKPPTPCSVTRKGFLLVEQVVSEGCFLQLAGVLGERERKVYDTFLKELQARGISWALRLSVTTSEAAELYHRVEPLCGSAHSQVVSAFGGVEPPTLPSEPAASDGGRTGRGDRGQPTARPSASSRETSRT